MVGDNAQVVIWGHPHPQWSVLAVPLRIVGSPWEPPPTWVTDIKLIVRVSSFSGSPYAFSGACRGARGAPAPSYPGAYSSHS